ncbi:MAG: L-2-amino-thiazoline-4-carboxylic acid hydrolase [candidate division Zixibacteria bacterium]
MLETVPACGMSCLALANFSSLINAGNGGKEQPEKHKFQKDFVQTYEQAFRWRFEYFIEYMTRFGEYLGRENLVNMLLKAVDDSNPPATKSDPDFSFSKWLEGGKIYENMMSKIDIEKTDNVYEMKVTECLWWKIFKEHNATDIGYAAVCYTDFSYAQMVHPQLHLKRTKTLMQGHDCCNHRWEFNG